LAWRTETDVRFAPKPTGLLRAREMTQCANSWPREVPRPRQMIERGFLTWEPGTALLHYQWMREGFGHETGFRSALEILE
jgi:hypothetical protein